MSCPNKMVDDMRGRGIATGATEPFTARKALDNAAWVVDSTVTTGLKVSTA